MEMKGEGIFSTRKTWVLERILEENFTIYNETYFKHKNARNLELVPQPTKIQSSCCLWIVAWLAVQSNRNVLE
jgi:hypothetical protein